MGFDLFQSRKNFHERCLWWARNQGEEYEPDEVFFNRVPDGTFYAKEVNPETLNNNIIAGVFFADRTTVTIQSPDDLSDLHHNKNVVKNEVMVKYQGEMWRVESVQKKKARIQNSEFANAINVSHYWYLSLVK